MDSDDASGELDAPIGREGGSVMESASAKTPQAGKKAPSFTLPGSEGGNISLLLLKGKWVVLYFYPKDNTPGCTVEAKGFRDAQAEFEARGAVVLGVSPDAVASHCNFRDRFQLPFPLLSDPDHAVAEKYGVWVEKSMYGRKYMGIQRSTFLIDKDGKIAQSWLRVKPNGHPAEVLAAIDTLAG
jgi:peroxiredoxin Q/BCP